jgi:predicted TIM-barrel fold metal-dependent hydrolase
VTVPQVRDDADVPAFWRALGLPGIADVHVHFLPPKLLQRVWAYFDDAGPLVGFDWPVRYRWPEAERVAYLRQLGVRRFTALAYAHRTHMAAGLNAWTLEFARATPECLPSATFYPEPGVVDQVTHALDAGARIFKIHLQVGGFRPDDPQLDAVWGLLSDAAVPVVVHAGHFPISTDHTGPEPFAALLSRHPRLAAIVAHMGAPDYEPFLRMAEKYERVALDTTMAFTPFFEQWVPFPRELLPQLRDLGLAGKVLLGSDFPNIGYPYADQLAGLVRLGLDEAWLRAVCWGNFTSMFGPSPGTVPAARTGDVGGLPQPHGSG